jgi:phage terminase small subunit
MTHAARPAANLGPRQERFVEEYLLDVNAKQAAIRAGYSPKTAEVQGSRLLSNAKVKRAIAARMAERSKRTEVTSDYVLSKIQGTIERCSQAEPVLDRKGEPVMTQTPEGELAPAYTFNAAGVLKGCELLGRHLGMFTDKLEVEDKRKKSPMMDMTEDEMFELLALRRAARARNVTRALEG